MISRQIQAQEKRLREMTEKARDLQLNTREIEGWMNGDFLSERPDVFNVSDGHQYVARNQRFSNHHGVESAIFAFNIKIT